MIFFKLGFLEWEGLTLWTFLTSLFLGEMDFLVSFFFDPREPTFSRPLLPSTLFFSSDFLTFLFEP